MSNAFSLQMNCFIAIAKLMKVYRQYTNRIALFSHTGCFNICVVFFTYHNIMQISYHNIINKTMLFVILNNLCIMYKWPLNYLQRSR